MFAKNDIYSWILLILLFLIISCHFIGCGSSGKKIRLLNFQAAEEMKLADKVTGIEKMNNKVAELENSVMKIVTQMEANLQAIAGVNNKINKTQQSAGRDVTQTTNESSLMKYIIGSIIGVIMFGLWIIYSLIKTVLENRGLKKSVKEKEIEADEFKKALALNTPQEHSDIFEELVNKIENKKRCTDNGYYKKTK